MKEHARNSYADPYHFANVLPIFKCIIISHYLPENKLYKNVTCRQYILPPSVHQPLLCIACASKTLPPSLLQKNTGKVDKTFSTTLRLENRVPVYTSNPDRAVAMDVKQGGVQCICRQLWYLILPTMCDLPPPVCQCFLVYY